MVASIKQIWIIGLFVLFTISVSLGQSNTQEKVFDYGWIENNVYKNKYFGLEIAFDTAWFVKNKKQMLQIQKAGREFTAQNDKRLKAIIKASEVNTANLFMMFKYGEEYAADFNPSFAVVAENIKHLPQIKTGKTYLFHLKNLLKLGKLTYIFDKELYQRKVGSKKFWVLDAEARHLGLKIRQEYLSAVFKGFTLSFIISYIDDVQKKELHNLLDNIKLD
ncbi:hypothetical protein BKI52_01590 [marine bacterium AO1-C]|nr:hypothetical protein BKI52_01590 [marine bacterium AO1-C]